MSSTKWKRLNRLLVDCDSDFKGWEIQIREITNGGVNSEAFLVNLIEQKEGMNSSVEEPNKTILVKKNSRLKRLQNELTKLVGSMEKASKMSGSEGGKLDILEKAGFHDSVRELVRENKTFS